MSFRNPLPPDNQNGAEGSAVPQRPESNGGKPMDSNHNLPDSAEVLERVEHGDRLAAAMALDGLRSPQVAEEIDHDTANYVGGELLDARRAIFGAAKALPIEGNVDLHFAFCGLLNEIDRVTGELAKRWSS